MPWSGLIIRGGMIPSFQRTIIGVALWACGVANLYADDGEPVRLVVATSQLSVDAVAFSPDERFAATGGGERGPQV
jgi:hypothetical protein